MGEIRERGGGGREVATTKNKRKLKHVSVRVFLATSHRKGDNCLNLRTLSIYVTSHLEESGSRIRHFNNAIGACNPLPFTLAYSTFPRWHFAQCQRHIHELPCRNCLLLGITTFLRNLIDISILLV